MAAQAARAAALQGAFVGREAELTRLEEVLAMALQGHGRLVLISGDAGIGKTRLAEELAGTAVARGALVAWSAGTEDAAAPPYWPWAQALRRCAQELGPRVVGAGDPATVELTGLLPDAFRPFHEDAEPTDVRHLRFRLFDGVASLLGTCARARPLVLVFDDVHWMDAPSLSLLEFVASQLHGHRILALATYRDPDIAPEVAARDDLVRLARVGAGIGLRGLEPAACRRLIEDSAGVPVSHHVASVVQDRTGGNPFFVGEVVRLLAAQGRLGALPGTGLDRLPALPRTVREVIDRRTARLSPACVRTLSRAAVIGAEFDAELLATVADASTTELEAALGEAVQAGVLLVPDATGNQRFAHPLIREALYADLSSLQRAQLHRRVGEAIEAAGDHPAPRTSALACHFRLAVPSCGPEKALEYGLLAAREAMELLAYEEAADHLGHVVELHASMGGDAAARGDLLLELGEASMRAGDWAGALHAYEQAAASARRRGDAVQLARAALGLGAGLSGFEVRLADPRQLELLEEAKAKLPPSAPLRPRVLARLSVASTLTRSASERADLSRRAVAEARRAGDAPALAYALSTYCDAIAGTSHSEERLELASEIVALAQRSGSRETELLGRRFRVVSLLEQGDLAGVDAEIARFERVAESLHQPLYRWCVPLWKGMRALTEGRLADCEASIAAARVIAAQAQSRNAELLASMLHLWWLTEAGRAEEAWAMLEDLADDPESGSNVALFRVRLRAAAGRHAEARSLLAALSADGFGRMAMEDTAAVHGFMWAAEGAVDLAEHQAAEALYDRLQPHAHRFGVSGIAVGTIGSVSRTLGRLGHLLGRWDVAEVHFGEAIAAHRRAGATLLLAHTLADQAAMLFDRHRAGSDGADRATAEAVLDEALAIYRELGLDWRVRQAQELRPAARAGQVATPPAPNTFRREGEVWTLVYGGIEARVHDAKGLHDLARLLSEPGREFHVHDLVAATAPDPRPGGGSDDLHEQGHAGEVIDEDARRQYRRRLTSLEEELQEAQDLGWEEQVTRLSAERDALVAELAGAYGLSGRPRRAGDPVERARSAVTWRIRAALKRIQRVHPALGNHLEHAVNTGTFCSYTPETPTTWSS